MDTNVHSMEVCVSSNRTSLSVTKIVSVTLHPLLIRCITNFYQKKKENNQMHNKNTAHERVTSKAWDVFLCDTEAINKQFFLFSFVV